MQKLCLVESVSELCCTACGVGRRPAIGKEPFVHIFVDRSTIRDPRYRCSDVAHVEVLHFGEPSRRIPDCFSIYVLTCSHAKLKAQISLEQA